MWGVWGNSLTHLVRLDKVTHVMQRARERPPDAGAGGEETKIRH